MKKEQFSSMDVKLQVLKYCYDWLRSNGIVKNQKQFADALEASESTISRAFACIPSALTDSLVERAKFCVTKYQEQMSKEKSLSEVSANNSPMDRQNQPMRYVPTIPIHAYKAINFDVMDYFETTSDELHMSPIIMQFPGTDCYYFVNSDEMSPNLRTNDLLCLSRLPDEAKVTNGDICIINTKYQGILGRFVYDDGDALILKSTQARWSDMRIPKDEVYSVFRILGGIRTNI